MNYGHDVMEIANALVSNNKEVLRSDAVKQAHVIVKFEKELIENKSVKFKFVKKDGTIREANGTKHPEVMNEYIKGTGKAKPRPDVIKYVDVDKDGIRSFNAMNLIG